MVVFNVFVFRSKPKTSLIQYGPSGDDEGSKDAKADSESANENLYLFKPGMIG